MKSALKFLVLGLVDVASITQSANKAGHSVFTLDLFGDLDTRKYSKKSLSILKEYGRNPIKDLELPDKFLNLAKKLIKENNIDAILLASGLDDEGQLLQSLHDLVPILGNEPAKIEKVRNRHHFFNELRKLKIQFPETKFVNNLHEGLLASRDIGFPLVIKPTKGYGGIGIRMCEERKDLQDFLNDKPDDEWIIQEFIAGTPASVSIIADGSNSKILTLNEQLLKVEEFGQKEEFRFTGNIVPLEATEDLLQRCEELTNKIVSKFELKGSNGIDLIITDRSDEINIIEVNPRFQATLECIERYLGVNLVDLHLKACNQEELPTNLNKPQSKFVGRGILYSKSNIKTPNLTKFDFTRDIPNPGLEIPEGEPICSVITDSSSREKCLQEMKKSAKMIYDVVIQ
ncbi:ATP-grasp domain-containing protein [[Eubacterium] cellulosolvens]